MTMAERNNKLKHLITCLKCEVRGKSCDVNCPTQYDAGNMGEIIENLEVISKALEQEPKIGHWRYVDYKNARCSNCNYIQTTKGLDKTMHCNIHKAIYKYCPNCGAKMESEG